MNGAGSRYSTRQESSSVRQETAAQQPIILPPPQQTSSSSRYSNEERRESSQIAQQPQYVPIAPMTGGGSSSRYSSSQSEYANTAGAAGNANVYIPIPYYTPSSSSSSSSQNSDYAASTSAGATLIPVTGGYIPRHGNYPSTTAGRYSSAHHGSSQFDGHASAGLSSYMSEAERLAKLQAQSVQGSGTYSGSSLVDSELSAQHGNSAAGISNDNALQESSGAAGSGGAGNGYVRTKSWENNSKWASGTQVMYFCIMQLVY